ncbi:MAG: hypothetical protein P3M75_00185 [Candidatus Hodgkinia cicadicola]|nr:MAG: hypothetical protein P3M75_00185 [Candidatus Hodgkinia cicadicola]
MLGFIGIAPWPLVGADVVNSQADLKLFCYGDLWTDWHHSFEDVGVVVGMLTTLAYTKPVVLRFASVSVPMDGSLTS